MPDIDSIFADAQEAGSADNFVDISDEERNSLLVPATKQAPVQPQAQPQSDDITEDGGLLGALGNAVNALRGGEGSGGSENWADSLMGDLRDQIDNTFGGDQLTREEITANMAGKKAERTKARAANPVSATFDEVTGVVQGATVGAVEATLTTGELIGDTVKTFTGLAQESDQVFNSKYEWAKWDLGKDEVGAKTGGGKIAQGFAEFGIVMAATGGFGGAGAGAGILKTAGVSAVKGLASDMILASKGEGNLSNLIKENAPEWYPTWLTALAVDEDDSPWEAMIKTGLEGMGLGAVADTAIGYVMGARAARKAAKAGLDVTGQEKAAIEASQAVVNKPQVPTGQIEAFNDALKTASPERFERMAPLLDQASKGIPTYYDDVANAFPEYFTIPGAKGEGLYHGTYGAKGISAEGFKASTGGTHPLGDGVYFTTNKDLAKSYGPETVGGSSQYLDIKELTLDELKQYVDIDAAEQPGDALRNAFGDQFDGVKVKGLYEGKPDVDEVVVFDPKVADGVASAPSVGREVLDEFSPAVYESLGKDFTLDPFTGEAPTTGTMVSIDGAVLDDVNPESVANFIAQNRDILSRDDVFLGSWVSEETGKPVIELSRRVLDPEEAQTLGRVFDQEGVFDLELANRTNFEEGYISTGGSDKLRTTKGGHIGSARDLPSEPTLSTPTRVAEQQAELRSLKDIGPRGDTGRTVTDAQIYKIAKGSSDQAGEYLRRIVDTNPINVEQLAKVSRQTIEEVTSEAGRAIQDSLNTAGEVDFEKILKQGVGDDRLLSREGIVQVRGLMQEMSSRIVNESIAIKKAGESGGELFTHFDRMVDQLKNLTYIHKESANAYSTYLSTYRIKVPFLQGEIDIPKIMQPKPASALAEELDGAARTLDELKKKVRSGDPKAKSEAIRLAASMQLADGDITKTLSFAKNANKLATGEWLNIMYNSMLSSPATHLVNTLSNAMQTIYRPLAAYAGGDAKQKKQAIAASYGFMNNLWESAQLAGKVFQDADVKVQGSKDFIQAGEAKIAMEQLSLAAEATTDLDYKAGVGYANMVHDIATFPLFSWPSKLLTTSDEFFKAMISRMEFQSRTMGDAIDAAGGSKDGIEAAYKELLEKTYRQNFTKSGEILNDDLLKVAKEGTFQTELEGVAKGFATFVKNTPGMRVFFPFVKTGHNIMVYTASHVPLLNRQLAEYRAVLAGTDEYAKAVFKGREAYGRAIIIMGAVAAYDGTITGNGPPDPAERKIWLQTNQPRSFKFGDKFIDYSRIEPFGQILSAVADLADMSKYAYKHGIGGDQLEYLAGYLTYAIANNFTNKSYMQGVVPLGKMLTPGWQGMSTLASLAPSTVNNFIPLSGARRAFSNALTPNMMEYQSQVDRVWAGMGIGGRPFGSVSHDWLDGSPLESPSGGLNAINPLKTVTRKQSIVRDALEDIGFDSSVIAETVKGVELSPKQLSEVQKLMGGSGLEDRLKDIIENPLFKKSRDNYFSEVRSNSAINKKEYWHYDQLQKEITSTRDWAIRRLRENHPSINAEIQAENDKRNQIKTNPFGSVQDFHKKP